MDIKPFPILEPLIEDLQNSHIGYYLKTNKFKKFMVRENLHDIWAKFYDQAKSSRSYFSFDLDHEPFDCQDALTLLLNAAYQQNKELFFNFSYKVIVQFANWDEKEVKLPYDELIEDFKLLDFPKQYIDGINGLRNANTSAVPLSQLPETIWNSAKLETFLIKMDEATQKGDYNLTLTYAYSCLEGMFKAFIIAKVPGKIEIDKLNQQAAIVRDYLKSDFDAKQISYPETVLNLIPTITNAISNARNGYSASHFDNNADKWLAEFSRDCVNSIARLIMKFIE